MTTVVTWNCNMAFRRKQDHILEYDPDVLVIQECENPDRTGEWSAFSDWRWVGENENKGLGVFCRNGRSITEVHTDSEARHALLARIDGSMDVLGIWAMNDEERPERRYIGQVYTALQDYRDELGPEVVVAGDFNWNVIWDESPPQPLVGDFAETLEVTTDVGLVSTYHRLNDSEFGDEQAPTFFMHKKQDRPYHTDYLFVPASRFDDVSEFVVGSYDEWIEASDHMPLVLELQ